MPAKTTSRRGWKKKPSQLRYDAQNTINLHFSWFCKTCSAKSSRGLRSICSSLDIELVGIVVDRT